MIYPFMHFLIERDFSFQIVSEPFAGRTDKLGNGRTYRRRMGKTCNAAYYDVGYTISNAYKVTNCCRRYGVL